MDVRLQPPSFGFTERAKDSFGSPARSLLLETEPRGAGLRSACLRACASHAFGGAFEAWCHVTARSCRLGSSNARARLVRSVNSASSGRSGNASRSATRCQSAPIAITSGTSTSEIGCHTNSSITSVGGAIAAVARSECHGYNSRTSTSRLRSPGHRARYGRTLSGSRDNDCARARHATDHEHKAR